MLQLSFDANALQKAAGRYQIPPLRLVGRAPGKGLATLPLRLDQTEATLDLAPETLIEGTLKAPDGGPAKDVRVHMYSVKCGPSDWVKPAWGDYTVLHTPPYMPQDAITDDRGHFTMHGLPDGGKALLQIFADHFARRDLYVSAREKQLEEHKGSVMVTAPPRFTLNLQPARIFTGRITDQDTGKPLPGVIVAVWAASMSVNTFGRTDADGDYRIGTYQSTSTDMNPAYAVTIHPPTASKWLGLNWQLPQWPDSSKIVFKKDFALTRRQLPDR